MASSRGEVIAEIERVLESNETVIGIAINFVTNEGTAVIGSGESMATSIAESSGADTVVVRPTAGENNVRQLAIDAGGSAISAFLSMPGKIKK